MNSFHFPGMSTVHEVLTAHHAGLVVFAFSLITNRCIMDYDCPDELNHQEVMDTGKRMGPILIQWISKVVNHIDNLRRESNNTQESMLQ